MFSVIDFGRVDGFGKEKGCFKMAPISSMESTIGM
jgi:hypothetical protein